MSHKLDARTAQALTNLRANTDFGQVLDWLTEYELKELQHCATYEGTPLYRAQGAVEALQYLRKTYEAAPQATENFKSKV